MTVDVPNLDTRTYDRLVAEARRRMSRYVPEWTDFNAGDPGTALLELFCWLAETLLYEANRVPDLAYAKFLDLLGFRQRPAMPAAVDVTFTPMPAAGEVSVPAGAQVAATGEDDLPVVFETDSALPLVRHPLTHVLTWSAGVFTPVRTPDLPGTAAFRPFGCTPAVMDALCLGFDVLSRNDGIEGPPGTFPEQTRLHVAVPSQAPAVPWLSPANQAAAPPVKLVWEYHAWRDDVGGATEWRPIPLLADDTGWLSREGYLTLGGPRAVPPMELAGFPVKYWLRCRVVKSGYPPGREPLVEAVTPNTVLARNLVTTREELLGQSEGHPDETYRLRHTPVTERCLVLCTRAESGDPAKPYLEERWIERADLLSSGPGDRHFVLEPTSGQVTFGNGRRGRIPAAGSDVVAAGYRHGGGRAGNVAAGTITTLLFELPDVASVTNRRAARGGADRQSLEELKREAPVLLRNQRRAVTASDYEELARRVPGIVGAKALALTHPEHPGEPVPGAVTVVVAAHPDVHGPRIHTGLFEQVCEHLERYRLLATELFVRQPASVPIEAEVDLEPDDTVTPDELTRSVRAVVLRFLSPFVVDENGTVLDAPFRSQVRAIDLHKTLMMVRGVRTVRSVSLNEKDVVALAPGELTEPGEIQLRTRPVEVSG